MASGTVTVKLSVKQQQALSELGRFTDKLSGIGKVAGIVSAALGGIGITALGKRAIFTQARTRELGVVMENMARISGKTVAGVRALEEQIKPLGITTQGARNILIQMMRAELDLTKATNLARVAQDSAVIAFTDTSTALERIIHGIVVGQPRVLRHAGIIVQFEGAYKRWAGSMGRTVESMTAIEKTQIRLNEVLEYGTRIQGTYEAAMTEAGKVWRSVTKRYIEEMFNAIGEIGMPILQGLNDLIKSVTTTIREWGEANQGILKQRVAEWVDDAREKLQGMWEWTVRNKDAIRTWGQVLVAAAIAAKIGAIAHSIGVLVTALKTLGVVAGLATLTTPLGALITVIAGAAAAITYFTLQSKEQGTTARHAAKDTAALVDEYKRLSEQERKTVWDKARLLEISDELTDALPDTTQAILNEAAAVEKLATAYDILNIEEAFRHWLPQIAKFEEEIEILEAKRAKINKKLETAHYYEGELYAVNLLKERGEIELKLLENTAKRAGAEQKLQDVLKLGDVPEPDGVPDPTGQKDAWASVLDDIHKMRLSLIKDQTHKEIVKAHDARKELEKKILETTKEGTAERNEAQLLAENLLTEKLRQIQDKQTKKTAQSDRDAAQVKVDLLMATLDHEQRVLAQGTEWYIQELEKRLEAERFTAEEITLIENKLRELRGEAAVERAEATRASWQNIEAEVKSVARAIARAVMFANDLNQAISDIGRSIAQKMIDRGIDAFIDKLFVAIQAARTLQATMTKAEAMGFMSYALKAFSFMPMMQHGGYVKRPTLAMVGEGKHDEIVSPVPMMRQIVREELAASGGGGGVNLYIDKIQALDGASVLETVRTGAFKQAIEEAVAGRIMKLNPGGR